MGELINPVALAASCMRHKWGAYIHFVWERAGVRALAIISTHDLTKPRTQEGPCLRELVISTKPCGLPFYVYLILPLSWAFNARHSLVPPTLASQSFVVVSQKCQRRGKGRAHNHSPPNVRFNFHTYLIVWYFWSCSWERVAVPPKKDCRIHFYSCLCFWSGEKSESRRSSPTKTQNPRSFVPYSVIFLKFQHWKKCFPHLKGVQKSSMLVVAFL